MKKKLNKKVVKELTIKDATHKANVDGFNDITFKTGKMVFKTMTLAKLKFNPLNPVIRTDDTHHGFKTLVTNIRKNGLLTPIIVANNGTVIDGNRRLSALNILGVKKAPVVMHNSTSHKVFDDLFVACNENNMAINCCQELERYLNGAKVRATTLYAIQKVQEVGGKRALRQLVNVGKSPITFHIALGQIRTYTGRTDREFLRKTLRWMLTVGSAYRLKAAINEFIPVPRLMKAIETGTPLVSKWHKSHKPIKKGENLTTIPVSTVQLNGNREIVGYTTV